MYNLVGSILVAFIAACTPSVQAASGPGLTAQEVSLVRAVERNMEAPGFLMGLLWEESKHATENGRRGDCGPFGIQPATASDVLGYRVTCAELQSLSFSLPIAVIYLTGSEWCGRYPLLETRLLCYRIGHNRTVTLRAYRNTPWHQMPLSWGTRKIMARIHAARFGKTMTSVGE